MLSFKPTFSLSSFTFIKRLFSSSSLSAIRVVPSVYLRLRIFLLAILILACASSSPAFHLMYSAFKLNKQGDNIQPRHTPLSLQLFLKYRSSQQQSFPDVEAFLPLGQQVYFSFCHCLRRKGIYLFYWN